MSTDIDKERLELVLEAAGLDFWENNLVTGEVPHRAVKTFAELGYSPEEAAVCVEDMFAFVHPDDTPGLQAALNAHLGGEAAQYRSEFRLRSKSGGWVWFANYGKIIQRGEDQSGQRLIGVTFNIDDRKRKEQELARLNEQLSRQAIGRMRAEEEVRASTRRLQRAELVSRCGNWELHLATQTIIASEGAAKLYGLEQNEIDYSVIKSAALPEYRPVLDAAREALIKHGQPYDVEYQIREQKNGTVLFLHSVAEFDPERGILFGVLQDITQRKQAEEALQAASRAKSELLANMSHEIRTPMNSLIGMTQLALQATQDKKLLDYLGKINQSGEHLLGLIDDILDFSKIDAGQLKLEYVDFDLIELRQTLQNWFAAPAAAKGLQLKLDFAADLPRLVRGDPLRLRQILLNFINNAIKFTEQGEVSVRARILENHAHSVRLHFEVRDSGIGISAAQQAILFQPFQQADSSTSRQYGGTGLGLVISQKLAALQRGTIGVSSELGQGSTFWFTVCLDKSVAQSAVARSEVDLTGDLPTLRSLLHGKQVLLAEDHRFNKQVATEFLQRAGITVSLASNGMEVLDRLSREHFDAVLMDIQMPLMDGFETTRRIRGEQMQLDLPIIAMTANVSNQDRERCLAAGMDDFVGKPFKPGRLYATLLRWLCHAPIPEARERQNAPCGGAGELWDWTVLAELVGQDRAKQSQFAEKYLRSVAEDLDRIEAAHAARDMTQLRHGGHQIKSAALLVGVSRINQLGQALEGLADDEFDAAAPLVAELTALLPRLRQYAMQFNLAAGG